MMRLRAHRLRTIVGSEFGSWGSVEKSMYWGSGEKSIYSYSWSWREVFSPISKGSGDTSLVTAIVKAVTGRMRCSSIFFGTAWRLSSSRRILFPRWLLRFPPDSWLLIWLKRTAATRWWRENTSPGHPSLRSRCGVSGRPETKEFLGVRSSIRRWWQKRRSFMQEKIKSCWRS